MSKSKKTDALQKKSLDKCAEELLLFGQLFHELNKENYHCPPSSQPIRKVLVIKILKEEQKLLREFQTGGRFKDSSVKRFISYRKNKKFYPNNVILKVVSVMSYLQIFEDVTGYSHAHLAK